MADKYTAPTPYGSDGVRGPVYDKAKADGWRKEGLKVTERTHRDGRVAYARVGVYPNKTERHGLLRRKRTSPDPTRVQYQLGKSAFGVEHE